MWMMFFAGLLAGATIGLFLGALIAAAHETRQERSDRQRWLAEQQRGNGSRVRL